ncbi:citramalate synthase [Candidatus Methylacidiphilum infernorum]|uniref:Citramalate synthase n=1 Tax=Methylacidiphilum infernorum (isolate V4) TaxID=481448 RepID=B3DYI6_METI4|nr:citramalate synthase [Candidatus Methylacidiphilum infernorum]ACD84034.1 Isopropylmalate/homocitrate/citramalate synthase [Methylacidiphilum infernorum V4]
MQTGKKSQLFLYDTTLRDGTQGEAIHFSLSDKLRIAKRLDEFGIQYIEGGWPGSNPKDFAFFNHLKDLELKQAKIAAFGSTRKAHLGVEEDPQIQLLLQAQSPVVTLFGKSWLFHVLEVLKTTAEENLAMIRDSIKFLKSHGREVIFDAEHFFDGFKADKGYALECINAAEESGADFIVLCDTNGGSLPWEIGNITAEVLSRCRTPVGIHTHNDGELAVANALVAIEAGALQVQGTINGYGERTGNCNLISVIANLELKMGRRVLPHGKLKELRELSLFIDEIANVRPNPRAPFVGKSAFAHKGGTHVNALQKALSSYEHIDPLAVGNTRRILIGELSGRSNIILKAKELGIALEENNPNIQRILNKIKELEAKGYEFESAEASFALLLKKTLSPYPPFFNLMEYHVSIRQLPAKNYKVCEATVKLSIRGERIYTVAEGDGPVHALDRALREALAKFYPEISQVRLEDYKVRIVDSKEGTASSIRVWVESTDGKRNWSTVGVSHDIVEASWLALFDSIEYWLLKKTEEQA